VSSAHKFAVPERRIDAPNRTPPMPPMPPMPPVAAPTAETTIDGNRTRRWVLDAQDCPLLAAHPPYERVRLRPGGSFFLASLEGEGRVLLEGRWARLGAGAVIMAPPRVLNAFFAPPGKRWVLAWMRYDEPPAVQPLVRHSASAAARRNSDASSPDSAPNGKPSGKPPC